MNVCRHELGGGFNPNNSNPVKKRKERAKGKRKREEEEGELATVGHVSQPWTETDVVVVGIFRLVFRQPDRGHPATNLAEI